MEKEANAQTKEEAAEETGKIQVSLVFYGFLLNHVDAKVLISPL